MQAVDVTGELWIDVDTPASLREARRHLLQSSGKNGADGYVAAYLNRRLSVPIAALLVQLSSVVDGCDGEVARLRHQATARGGGGGAARWIDTMLDRYADAAVVVGITLGYAAGHASVLPLLGGMAASTGFLLASYATKEYALSHGAPYPNDWLNRLKRRDLRLLVIACGGLSGIPTTPWSRWGRSPIS